MKKILFPATNRVHLARQKILLEKLGKHFQVDIQVYQSPYTNILNAIADYANFFRKTLKENYDVALIRGDRYEMLPIAMLCAYRGLKIAHIEGGDISGAIDNKVRHAITALAEIHFATNKESYTRLISMGTNPEWTFDFGSLDVEYAKSIKTGERRDYVVICFHPMKGENPLIVEKAVESTYKGRVIIIKSNKDNGSSYGTEEFLPDEYIKLIAEARCLIGNSSSFLKEASVFGTPVVNIGERQKNRLRPPNVKDADCDELDIAKTLEIQLTKHYEFSSLYYKINTSDQICEKLLKYLD